jgi:hypothetical protein
LILFFLLCSVNSTKIEERTTAAMQTSDQELADADIRLVYFLAYATTHGAEASFIIAVCPTSASAYGGVWPLPVTNAATEGAPDRTVHHPVRAFAITACGMSVPLRWHSMRI